MIKVLPDLLFFIVDKKKKEKLYYHHAQVDLDYGQVHIVWWLSYCQPGEKISVESWTATGTVESLVHFDGASIMTGERHAASLLDVIAFLPRNPDVGLPLSRMLLWLGSADLPQGSITPRCPPHEDSFNEDMPINRIKKDDLCFTVCEYMFLISSCSCLCPIQWSQVLSQEWRCSWSSADRRCSNYIWVINNFIAY